jgi:hypothetical protein
MIARRGNQPVPKIARAPDRRRTAQAHVGLTDRPATIIRRRTGATAARRDGVRHGRHAIRDGGGGCETAQGQRPRRGDGSAWGHPEGVTGAAPRCGARRSRKRGRISSGIAGCPFRCRRISGGSKDTTSSTAERQHDLPHHAQQTSLCSQWRHSGPVQPRPPTSDRLPSSGRLRPAQRCSDLRRCDECQQDTAAAGTVRATRAPGPADTSPKNLGKDSALTAQAPAATCQRSIVQPDY